MRLMRPLLPLALGAALSAAVACRGSPATAPADAAVDPLLSCPGLDAPQALPSDPVEGHTFGNFALPAFFSRYCTRCHSVTLTDPAARNNAAPDVNLDDEASVRAALSRIRVAVAVPVFMPPGPPRPTCAERAALLAWIDAGAP